MLSGEKSPIPPDQIPPEAPVIVPASVAILLFEHFIWSTPASTNGADVNVICIWSLTELQVPLPVVVSVSHTKPVAISGAEGEYVVASAVEPGLYKPVPPVH